LFSRTRKDLQEGRIAATSASWLAFLYYGDVPGEDFEPGRFDKGFLRGFFLNLHECQLPVCFRITHLVQQGFEAYFHHSFICLTKRGGQVNSSWQWQAPWDAGSYS